MDLHDRMALLLGTNEWAKVLEHRYHLTRFDQTAWRIGNAYTGDWLAEVPCPIRVFFFMRSMIKWAGNCIAISGDVAAVNRETELPEPYRGRDTEFYRTVLMFDAIQEVRLASISDFAKWDDRSERFGRGQQGILRVVDPEGAEPIDNES